MEKYIVNYTIGKQAAPGFYRASRTYSQGEIYAAGFADAVARTYGNAEANLEEDERILCAVAYYRGVSS